MGSWNLIIVAGSSVEVLPRRPRIILFWLKEDGPNDDVVYLSVLKGKGHLFKDMANLIPLDSQGPKESRWGNVPPFLFPFPPLFIFRGVKNS